MSLDISAPPGRTIVLEPALSWSAIFAGALVGLATMLILTLLAAGLGYNLPLGGLASRAYLASFTPEVGAALIVAQVLAGGFAGYLAGRLRHAWLNAHSDEAHFRDTAHGVLAWALSTLVAVIVAATVLTPYAAQMAMSSALALPASVSEVDALRASNIAMQASLFTGIGMLLSAFIAAVAARIGGMRSEEMHAKFHA